MAEKIWLSSPHMSDEGYEQEYIQEAFDTNWIAPLGTNVNEFEKELANKVGTKKSYISRLENGKCDIQLSTLYRIFEDGLGIRVSLLIG